MPAPLPKIATGAPFNTASICKMLINLPDSVPDKIKNKATLANILLAKASSMLVFSPGHIETLAAKFQTTIANNPKISAKMGGDAEATQTEVTRHTNNRKALERHFMEYANNRGAQTQQLVQDMVDGKISPEVLLNKINELDKKSDELTKKITAITKESQALEEKLKSKLEEILKQIPGGGDELRKLLNPDTDRPQIS